MGAPRAFSDSFRKWLATPIRSHATHAAKSRMVATRAFSERADAFLRIAIFHNPYCRSSIERVSHGYGELADASREVLRAGRAVRWLRLRRYFAVERCRGCLWFGRQFGRRGDERERRCEPCRRCLQWCGWRWNIVREHPGLRWQCRKIQRRAKQRRTACGQWPVSLCARMPRRLKRLQSRRGPVLRRRQSDPECCCGVGLRQPLHFRFRLLGCSVRC